MFPVICEMAIEATQRLGLIPGQGFIQLMLIPLSCGLFIASVMWMFDVDLDFTLLIAVVILFHELGHWFVGWLISGRCPWLAFIPFLGGVVILREVDPEKLCRWERSLYILAGPIPGLLLALSLYCTFGDGAVEEVKRISTMFYYINLYNLLPLYPLDGGQLLATWLPDRFQRGIRICGFTGVGLLGFWWEWVPMVILGIVLLALECVFADEQEESHFSP